MFSRRHYEAVAATLGRALADNPTEAQTVVLYHFCDTFATDNPRFNAERFNNRVFEVAAKCAGRDTYIDANGRVKSVRTNLPL